MQSEWRNLTINYRFIFSKMWNFNFGSLLILLSFITLSFLSKYISYKQSTLNLPIFQWYNRYNPYKDWTEYSNSWYFGVTQIQTCYAKHDFLKSNILYLELLIVHSPYSNDFLSFTWHTSSRCHFNVFTYDKPIFVVIIVHSIFEPYSILL